MIWCWARNSTISNTKTAAAPTSKDRARTFSTLSVGCARPRLLTARFTASRPRAYAFYGLDTLQFSPQWELNLGVRWDHVEARASDEGWEAKGEQPIDVSRTDEEWSYSAGLVYKPVTNMSLYAAYGTAFEISGTFDRNQVQLAGRRRQPDHLARAV